MSCSYISTVEAAISGFIAEKSINPSASGAGMNPSGPRLPKITVAVFLPFGALQVMWSSDSPAHPAVIKS